MRIHKKCLKMSINKGKSAYIYTIPIHKVQKAFYKYNLYLSITGLQRPLRRLRRHRSFHQHMLLLLQLHDTRKREYRGLPALEAVVAQIVDYKRDSTGLELGVLPEEGGEECHASVVVAPVQPARLYQVANVVNDPIVRRQIVGVGRVAVAATCLDFVRCRGDA